MGKFNKNFKSADRHDRKMHKAVCDSCGRECEVPFLPSGDKPVFCDNCFRNKPGSDQGRRRDNKRSDFGPKRMYSAICSKCGKSCELPFEPRGNKPVFCSECFEKGGRDTAQPSNIAHDQFAALNKKLDKIIELLERCGNQKENPAEPTEEKPAKASKISKQKKEAETKKAKMAKNKKPSVKKKK